MFDTTIAQTFSAVGIGTGDTGGKLLAGDQPAFICVDATSAVGVTMIVQCSPDDGATWYEYFASPGTRLEFALSGNKNQAIRLENISQRLFWRCRCAAYGSGSVVTKIVQ